MGYANTLTQAGFALQAKLFAEGGDLHITRVAVGNGISPEGSDMTERTGLVEERGTATSTTPIRRGCTVDFFIEYRSDLNPEITEMFQITEYGVFGLGAEGKEELLFYGDVSQFPETAVPAQYGGSVRRYPVHVEIGAKAGAVLDYPAGAWCTYEDITALQVRVERLEKYLAEQGKLTGETDPTAQTEAQVGQTYLNTTTGKEFICIAVTEEGTVWLEKLTGEADPTAQTAAQVGQVYVNTTTRQEFVCTAVTEEGTVWEPRGTAQSGIPTVEVTQEEYDALSEEDKQKETLHVLPDGVGGLEIRYKGKVLSNGPSIVAGENVKLEEKDGKLIISFPSLFQELTQEEYDAMGENKPKMLYLVTG